MYIVHNCPATPDLTAHEGKKNSTMHIVNGKTDKSHSNVNIKHFYTHGRKKECLVKQGFKDTDKYRSSTMALQ